MSYWGSDPDDSDYASGAVGVIILLIKERMINDMEGAIAEEFPEQSLIVSLQCLRLIGERFRQDLSVHFEISHLKGCRELFDQWYTLVQHKLPKKFKDEILAKSIAEFELFEAMLNTPKTPSSRAE